MKICSNIIIVSVFLNDSNMRAINRIMTIHFARILMLEKIIATSITDVKVLNITVAYLLAVLVIN